MKENQKMFRDVMMNRDLKNRRKSKKTFNGIMKYYVLSYRFRVGDKRKEKKRRPR